MGGYSFKLIEAGIAPAFIRISHLAVGLPDMLSTVDINGGWKCG